MLDNEMYLLANSNIFFKIEWLVKESGLDRETQLDIISSSKSYKQCVSRDAEKLIRINKE
jgi:hypothetical protein